MDNVWVIIHRVLVNGVEVLHPISVFATLDELTDAVEKYGSTGTMMVQEFYAAQQSVQRTAYGSGLRVWFANIFIRFGWWLAELGSR